MTRPTRSEGFGGVIRDSPDWDEMIEDLPALDSFELPGLETVRQTFDDFIRDAPALDEMIDSLPGLDDQDLPTLSEAEPLHRKRTISQ